MIIGISGHIGNGKDTVARIIQYLSIPDHDSCTLAEYYANKWRNDKDKWQTVKFEDKRNQCIALILGIPVEDLEKEEVKNRVLGEEWHRYFNWHYKLQTSNNPKGKISKYSATIDDANEDFYLLNETISGHQTKLEALTIRQLLQEFGTEVGRSIHPSFWINALFADYISKGELIAAKIRGHRDSSAFAISQSPTDPMNWIISDVRFPNEAEAIKSRGGIVIRVNRINSTPQDGHTYVNKQTRTHPSETALDNYQFDEVIENEGTIEELIEKVKVILIKYKLL